MLRGTPSAIHGTWWSVLFSGFAPGKAPAEGSDPGNGLRTGANLWFAAREGFQVGIDGSAAAIAYARKRFEDEGIPETFGRGIFANCLSQRTILTWCWIAVPYLLWLSVPMRPLER